MYLEEIEESELYNTFNLFCEKSKRYYIIIDDNENEIGVFGIKKLFQFIEDTCEISLYIFKNKRYHPQYKKIIKFLLDYPFLVNFNCILIHTTEKSVQTFLKACKKWNVKQLTPKDETWFFRKKI